MKYVKVRIAVTVLMMIACAVGVFALPYWLRDSEGSLRMLWGAAALALIIVVLPFFAMGIWSWRLYGEYPKRRGS